MCNFKIENLLLSVVSMFSRSLPGDKWLSYGLNDDYLWKFETSWKCNVSIAKLCIETTHLFGYNKVSSNFISSSLPHFLKGQQNLMYCL